MHDFWRLVYGESGTVFNLPFHVQNELLLMGLMPLQLVKCGVEIKSLQYPKNTIINIG
jgi:hypothetical protein